MTAARELGPSGITANAIAPGVIGTAVVRSNLGDTMLAKIATQVPLRRIGEPPEVGRVVAFLASEAASYLNGAVIDISGGRIEYFYG
jgi:3-oxoacyl-[acyl-carrier protein] reductase